MMNPLKQVKATLVELQVAAPAGQTIQAPPTKLNPDTQVRMVV